MGEVNNSNLPVVAAELKKAPPSPVTKATEPIVSGEIVETPKFKAISVNPKVLANLPEVKQQTEKMVNEAWGAFGAKAA